MQSNYTPSINIVRDTDRNFTYIPTPNSQRVVSQIVDDYKKGIRAFTLIGSYGTGKSSFLLALEQSLNGKQSYFEASFRANQKFGIVKVVGAYQSIIDAFADELKVTAKENLVEHVLSEIYNRYNDLGKEAPLLFIVIDEFGKFLEYAAKNDPEKELYFVQQLAEFAADSKYNIALLTTIHQSFESYGFSLSTSQRQEWAKVKGRFREITFNEPVEQLLFLASEHISRFTQVQSEPKKILAAYTLFKASKAFSFNEDYSDELYSKIYPLDLLAANTLTYSLQDYGQNERSLFSFLESTDHTSLAKFNSTNSPFYHLANVYDYVHYNFFSYLTSRYNTDFAAWVSITSALETVERTFDYDLEAYTKLVKAIGILNIFAASGSALDEDFWISYAKTCLGIPNAESILANLEVKKIIFYRRHSKRFILFEGTDLDLNAALIEAANKVNEITDVKSVLDRYLSLPPVLAKSYSYTTGTPRAFEFVISDSPISKVPVGEIDGFVNLIFNEKLTADQVQAFSAQQEEAIIYAYYENANEIKQLLYEIEKTKKVLEENHEDKVARRELENMIFHQTSDLNQYLINNLYGDKADVIWFWRGDQRLLKSKKEFNALLSEASYSVYLGTPIFRNELVNRHKVSNVVQTAKKSLFFALTNNWGEKDLGFNPDKYPAEKTIYRTLIERNGLYSNPDQLDKAVNVSSNSTFKNVWNYSIEFLNSAKEERVNLNEFVKGLQQKPYKLKQGLIDFWVPIFLYLNRNDFALYSNNSLIPNFNDQILDLISRNPKDFTIKAFDVVGVRLDIFNSYRILLNQETKDLFSGQSFLETIKPFLIFYRGLPEYSKKTTRLSPEALAVREVVAKSQDPEKVFFEELPTALGTSMVELEASKEKLNKYVNSLQDAIREIRTSHDELVKRFEEFIQQEVVYEDCSFETYKDMLQKRYKGLKKHLLLPRQRPFVQRLDSALDDRKAWLNSLSQAVVGRSLENISDEEELLLRDKFKTLILELDSLTNLSAADVDTEKEDVLGLQFDSFVDGMKRSLVRLPKKKAKEVNEIQETLKAVLSKDKSLNIAALANLLKELTQG
jgi:hypothetical protein